MRRRSAPPRSASRHAARPRAAGLGEVLVAVWRQLFAHGVADVTVGRRRFPAGFTATQHLRTLEVPYGRYRLFGVEQNPRTSSRWAKLARQGKRIMQFSYRGRYVANVCEGELYKYPAWRAMNLPD